MTRDEKLAEARRIAKLNQARQIHAATTDSAPKEEPAFDFSALQMFKNVPPDAAQYGKDVVTPFTHPVDTAKAVYGLGKSLAWKGVHAGQELVTGQKQPDTGEESADAVKQAMIDQYGSVDAFKRSLQEHPVRTMADAAALLTTGGAGLAATGTKSGLKLARAAAVLEPVNATLNPIRVVAQRILPKAVGQKMYQSAAKLNSTVADEEKLVRTAMDNQIVTNDAGVAKLREGLKGFDTQLDGLIAKAYDEGTTIPTTAALAYMNDLRGGKMGFKIDSKKKVRAINKIWATFREDFKGIDSVTPKEMLDFKRDIDKEINWQTNPLNKKAKPVKEETYRAIRLGAKDAIVNAVPGAEELNQKMSDLLALEGPLIKATKRVRKLPVVSPMISKSGMGSVLGYMVGMPGVGTAIGLGNAILSNPIIKQKVALGLYKLKNGDVDWLKKNLTQTEIRLTMSLAGREQQAEEKRKAAGAAQ